MAGVTLIFRFVNAIAANVGQQDELGRLILDQQVMAVYSRALWVTCGVWLTLLVTGFFLRLSKWSSVYVATCLQVYWLTTIFFGWCLGVLNGAFAVTILASTILLLMLFGPRHTYASMAPATSILGAGIIAERFRIIDYAPLLQRQPFDATGHPIAPWILANGWLTIAIMIVTVSATQMVITRWREYDKALEQMSATDQLTGLLNRRSFLSRSIGELSRARRSSEGVAVIMVDIDHFKTVNDTWGHSAGDEVLKAVAEALRNEIRDHDLAARWGGEEFLVFLYASTKNGAQIAAERLRQAIERCEIIVDEKKIEVTATFGVAWESISTDSNLDLMIRQADQALYAGKSGGRNCVNMY